MEYIAQAIEKNTKRFLTCTHCDTKEDAIHYAKYYRSIGYNAKVYDENEYIIALEKDAEDYKVQRKLELYSKLYID